MKFLLFVIFLKAIFIAEFAVSSTIRIQGEDILTGKDVTVTAGTAGLVVVFLSARCPCSKSHVNELGLLSKEYPEFSFVGVHSNVDETREITQAYFQEANLRFPIIQDRDAKIADEFKALKTPHAFVLRAKGEFLYQGGVSNSKDCEKADRKFLREALEDLHRKKAVRTAEGRTLGCAISRGEKYVW